MTDEWAECKALVIKLEMLGVRHTNHHGFQNLLRRWQHLGVSPSGCATYLRCRLPPGFEKET